MSPTRGQAKFTTCRIQNSFHQSYSATHGRSTIANHAHLTWKRFQQQSLFRGRTFVAIYRIAQAVSLALSRPYVAFPGIFALTCGRNVALARALPDADFISPRNALYMHAQDGHVYFTSLIRSIFYGIVLLLRAFYLAVLFSPSIVMAPFVDVFGPRYMQIWLQVVRQTLEKAGPAFIKWGQWAATRPDLFTSSLCTELSKLQTNAPEHSFAYTKKTIKRAFGRKLLKSLMILKKTLSSGSIPSFHRASLHGTMVDNFVHADMHPGNILVRVTQSKSSRKRIFKSKPHVIFLDVGMTAELSSSDRISLLEFFKAVARRDGRTAAECTLKLSKKQNCPNPEAFIKEVKESFDFWGTDESNSIHPAECMQRLLEQVRRHRVNIDGNVCTVMVTTLVLEGWQRKLDPDYDVMHTLQTLLLKSDWAESLSYTIEGLMAP
nr:probable serine/threonine-protein kinase abkC [Ipomoea batatas]